MKQDDQERSPYDDAVMFLLLLAGGLGLIVVGAFIRFIIVT